MYVLLFFLFFFFFFLFFFVFYFFLFFPFLFLFFFIFFIFSFTFFYFFLFFLQNKRTWTWTWTLGEIVTMKMQRKNCDHESASVKILFSPILSHCGVDVLDKSSPHGSILRLLSSYAFLFHVLLDFVLPSLPWPAPLPRPLYFQSHHSFSHVVLFSSHYTSKPPRPLFLHFPWYYSHFR